MQQGFSIFRIKTKLAVSKNFTIPRIQQQFIGNDPNVIWHMDSFCMGIQNGTLYCGSSELYALTLHHDDGFTAVTDFIDNNSPTMSNFCGWGDDPLWFFVHHDVVYAP